MRYAYYGAMLLCLLSGCSRGPRAGSSTTKDVTLDRNYLTCQSDWRCGASGASLGTIHASHLFNAGEQQACAASLLQDLGETGTCPAGLYRLIDGTFSTQLSQQTVTVLTCSSGVGMSLCQAIQDLESAMNWNCTGGACTDIWRNQYQQMTRMTQWESYLASTAYNISLDIGDKLHHAAITMCSVKITGNSATVRQMVQKTNEAGAAMDKMQRRAGVPNAYLCTLQIN